MLRLGVALVPIRARALSLLADSQPLLRAVSVPYRYLLALQGVIDRVRAKLAFHDSRRFRHLVEQTFHFSGQPTHLPEDFTRLRRFDPGGLGIWYLARGGRQARLEDLCQQAIALRGFGTPRPI